MTFLEALISKGKEAGLSFSEKQLEQFSLYFDLLIETNKVMNLSVNHLKIEC